jgi:hypothetical protein
MLCFILDTPYRGRYFHDCNTPEHFGFAVPFPFLCPRRLPSAGSICQRREAQNSSKPGPDSLNAASQKFQIFI